MGVECTKGNQYYITILLCLNYNLKKYVNINIIYYALQSRIGIHTY